MSFIRFRNHAFSADSVSKFELREMKANPPATQTKGQIWITSNFKNSYTDDCECCFVEYDNYQDAQKEFEEALVQLQKASIQKN